MRIGKEEYMKLGMTRSWLDQYTDLFQEYNDVDRFEQLKSELVTGVQFEVEDSFCDNGIMS